MITICHGDSMYPTFRKGWSIISIRKIDGRYSKLSDFLLGDIVLYTSKGFDRKGNSLGHTEEVIHRIVKFDNLNKRMEIKGDNRKYTEWVSLEKVHGVLEKVIW